MTEAENKLATYLGFDITMDQLLEIWEKLGGITSADELGIADRIVEECGWEPIVKLFSKDLISRLVSKYPDDRKEAMEQMAEMGFGAEGSEEVFET